jgi:WD40 repeat protein/serine/threonine protein kinase
MMSNQTICRKCGAPLGVDARQGFCPKCLFAQATADDFDDASVSQLDASKAPAAEGSSSADQSAASTMEQQFPRAFANYELLEEIARGGMGIVYRARHVSLERIVAVKMLLFGPLASPDFVKRFRAEASAAASLQHANIVAIHDVGVHQGQQYFAMDYVEGQSLARLLANGPLPATRAARYLKTTAEAIHYAHERGILHRDLKPSNVLIDANDQPRVTDFGLARRLEGDSELTMSGQVLGSPNYMPPEQAAGKRGKVSRRSDVYSLGAMLYHLLTGRPPFVGEALTDTLQQVLNSEPVSPRLLNPSVPRDLETICLKCLEKEPSRRYQTAQELADELGRFLNNEPTLAHPVSRAERVWRWCRRKPALASFATATSLLLFGILIGSPIALYRINHARKTARQNQYASDMFRAHQAINEGDLFSALRLLNRNQMDLRGWEWRYLWQQCQGEQLFILGHHSNGVTAVGVLPDGKIAYSAGKDKAVRLWNLESKEQIGLLPHDDAVAGAACSPDGRWLATATASDSKGALRLWDLATRKAVVLTTNIWLRPSIAFSPDSNLLAFATYFQGIRLWSLAPRQEITNLPAYFHFIDSLGLAFSPDRQTLAYNENEGGDIVLWDIRSRSVIRRLKGHSWYVSTLAFTPDAQTLASGSKDRSVKLWDCGAGREAVTFTNYTGPAGNLRISPDGTMLATVSSSSAQQVTLQELRTGREVLKLRGHQNVISDVGFSPDGRTLFTGSQDGSVRVWNVTARPKQADNRQFATGLGEFHGGTGTAVCLSPDGRHLLSVFTDDSFSVWDLKTLAESQHHRVPLSQFACAALASGGEVAAFVPRDGNVILWHRESGETNWFGRPTTDPSSRALFSQDGKLLAISGDRGLCVCDVSGKTKLHTFPLRAGDPLSLAFSRDGRKLAVGYSSGVVKIWDLARRTNEITLRVHNPAVRGLALLPDERTLIAVGRDIQFWDLNSQRELFRLKPRPTNFRGCSISPDGRRLAVGAFDGLVTVWDLDSRQEVATLNGDERPINAVSFLPDGNTLVSVGQSQLRVWRAAPLSETDAQR